MWFLGAKVFFNTFSPRISFGSLVLRRLQNSCNNLW